MIFSKKLLPGLFDGNMKEQDGIVFGTFHGFDVLMTRNVTSGNQTVMRVRVNAANDDENATGLAEYMTSLKLSEKFVATAEVDGKSVMMSVYINTTAKKQIARLNEILGKVVEYLEMGGYRSGCSLCGTPGQDEFGNRALAKYIVDGSAYALCPECAEKLKQSLDLNAKDAKNTKSNLAPGIVGALIGAAIGGVVWVLIGLLGYIAGIAGFAIVALSIWGYGKLGKVVDVKGVVVCIIASVVMLYLSNHILWSISLYEELKEYYDITFFDAYRALHSVLSEIGAEVDFWRDFAIGFFFTVLASVGTLIRTFRASTGAYTFRKID